MKIIFFSEIQWDYLRTRKQQIISRFPKDWMILFLQPYKARRKNYFSPVWHDNICVATMPFFLKNFKPDWIRRLLSFKLARFFILLIGWFWTREIIRQTEFHSPDLIMCSNIYAAPFIKMLAGMMLPVIYDMNDDHLAFPNTPQWARSYFESLCTTASRIILPCESMRLLLPAFAQVGDVIITNGVDISLFNQKRRIILYAGALSEWIDVDLLERIAESFPDEILRLIGPVVTDVTVLSKHRNVEFVGQLPHTIMADQIKQATVCLVPFKTCPLTAHTSNINKVFEYLAAGKPVVSSGRPKAEYERDSPGLLYSVKTADEFIDSIRMILSKDIDTALIETRKSFARDYDWDKKAKEMIDVIRKVMDENISSRASLE